MNRLKLFFSSILLILVSCNPGDGGLVFPPVTPDVPPEDVTRICVIGDGGTGKADQYYVAHHMAKEGCERILYVGDVIYETGLASAKDADFQEKFYKPYKQLLEEFKIPFYLSMGNHDWYNSSNPVPIWQELAKTHDNIIYDNYMYAKKFGGVCVLQAETYVVSLFDEQLEWFNEFKNDEWWNDCKFTIAFGHHPYWSSGKHGDADSSRSEFLDDLVLGHFDLYVAGHDHQLSDESEKLGTKFLISGSAGKTRGLASEPYGGFGVGEFGYLVIDIRNNVADFKFVTVDKMETKEPWRGTIEGQGFRK